MARHCDRPEGQGRVSRRQDGNSKQRSFDGECWTCGRYGHKSDDCRIGKDNSSRERQGDSDTRKRKLDRIIIPGCMALLDTPTFTLLEYLIVIAVVLLAMLLYTWSSLSRALRLLVTVLVAPIMSYQFDTTPGSLTMKMSSVVASRSRVSVDTSKAILDSGAALHILNSKRHMKNVSANNSYSIVGVSGSDNKPACEHTGHVNMSFRGVRWDDSSDCIVTVQSDTEEAPNALHCSVSPLNLVSLAELLDAGWLCYADYSGIYHSQYRVSIYVERVDGLSYMPLVSDAEYNDDGDGNVKRFSTCAWIAMSRVGTLLSFMVKYCVTVGGQALLVCGRRAGRIVQQAPASACVQAPTTAARVASHLFAWEAKTTRSSCRTRSIC